MADSFDAYYRWLGIPPEDQPPNHYRLLGIKLFEGHAEVVESAADRQMGHLRTFQTGQHTALSQKLLNEVAAAKICLLNPDKKAAYDEALRNSLAAELGPPPLTLKPTVPLQERPGRSPGLLVGVSIGLAALVVIVLWLVLSSSGRQGPELSDRTQPSAEPAQTSPPAPPAKPESMPEPKPEPKPERKPEPSPVPTPEPKPVPAPPTPPKPVPEQPAKPPEPSPTPSKPPEPKPVAKPEQPVDRSGKLPMPEESDLRRAAAQVAVDFKLGEAKTAAAKLKQAQEIVDKLAEPKLTPAERFAMLKRAAELAAAGGGADLMIRCAEQLGTSFECDVLAEKVELLSSFAEKASDAARIQSLLGLSAPVLEEALSDDRIELAQSLSTALARASVRPAAKAFRLQFRECREQVDRLARQWARVEQALQTLKQQPDDPAANESAGQWYCLLKSDWETGLPYLAKSQDPALAALAQQETKHPTAPADKLSLADGWWDYGKKVKPPLRDAALVRAGDWYLQVQPDLQDEARRKLVAKRLDEVAKLSGTAVPRKQAEPFENSVGMKFVPIPTGEFTMGSTPEDIAWCTEYLRTHYGRGGQERMAAKFEREGPARQVRIDQAFSLDAYEVTQRQYEKVMGNNPSQTTPSPVAGQGQWPVENVSWLDAIEFCNRLSDLPAERAARRKYRLPSDAEWEYACRAGTTGRGPRMSTFWYGSTSGGSSHPVGEKQPNDWQLYDMIGNVAEWCLNVAEEDPFRQVPLSLGASVAAAAKSVRGGSYRAGSLSCRPAFRDEAPADTRRADIGFRVACVTRTGPARVTIERRPAAAKKAAAEARKQEPPKPSVN